MTAAVNRFYNGIKNARDLKPTDLVGYFAYFLTAEEDGAAASTAAIEDCFSACDLTAPGNTSAYLSRSLGGKGAKFVKVPGGYRLQRGYRDEIAASLGASSNIVQTSAELRKLESRFPSGAEKGFLTELINCFEMGAGRAAIVMCWILVIDHLYAYVLTHHLSAFNAALAKNTDKRVRVSVIQGRDDFSDIPEGKFIEFLRSANIVSSDVRKILDAKLGIRNTSAHPSSVAIKPSKVVEFVDDLIENVILKYSI
ncbi:hypothetical protein RX327_01280 [Bradyrhizobium sp. BEA-2-5]|uniref:hypothetical protein n=1 Tax=Bradyrhizobium TaxID=374 RepID=UPI000AB7EBC3|nr:MULTISPECIES: hypothetical protein [Bradyrhizobium]WOH81880.1 hypothetical protein RX327_01280 [Bradyrhizobium sp. BEA-2-5]